MKKNITLLASALMASLMICIAPFLANAENLEMDNLISTSSKSLEVDDLLADAESLVGKKVTIEGVCTHVCSHGGAKLFLMGSDDSKVIRVQAGEVGSFDAGCKNSMLTIKGTLKEERIDEAYLVNLETKAAAEAKEESGHEGHSCCSSGEGSESTKSNAVNDKIANYRKQISEREKKEGKAYLSFFFLEAEKYDVQ